MPKRKGLDRLKPLTPLPGRYISTTRYYDGVVTARVLEKGIGRSEACRQLIDDALGRNGYRTQAIRQICDLVKTLATSIAMRHGGSTTADAAAIIEHANKIRSLS